MCDWCGCGQPNNPHTNTGKLHEGMRTTAGKQDMIVKSTVAKTSRTTRRQSRQAAVR